MSKNVAVFVDVANIFYAAKAAGTDIDYVTLLKSATAGRDFVRAYAYTGLDPENENQRQFHAFLARSGYKVVSKDIRKYGDGRIKANLDIELVVDLMRMGSHLDIAVVVSGDGDFAPAIRAVQQMGVRVEVISFRGNTSSDLIEVADVFTDITQIARVEKGERSGRRVAAEGDLSMTEVPDKESEGAARRRRTRRPIEREPVAAVAAEPGGLPGNLIVLPGERLSRGSAPGAIEEAVLADASEPETDAGAPAAGSPADAAVDADGRRRRRRRGGRGRGRGRQGEPEMMPVADGGLVEGGLAEEDDDEYLDEAPVAVPQHSTFGSVWDTQLGVTTAPPPAAAQVDAPDEEEYEDEPEVPEYLLAERRQQGAQRGGQRGRGGRDRAGGYRSALDRERYGRSGTSAFGGGGGGGGMRPPMRAPERSRGGRDGGRDARPIPRPDRPAYREPVRSAPPAAPSPTGSAEPWSEVPPEVQELLRAELARRSSRPGPGPGPLPGGQAGPEAPSTDEVALEDAAAPIDAETSAGAPAARPARRTSAPSPRASRSRVRIAAPSAEEDADQGSEAPPAARTTRARRSTTPAASTETTPAEVDAATEASPARRRAPRRAAASTVASEVPAEVPETDEASAEAPAAAPRRRSPRRKAATGPATPTESPEG